MNDLIPVPKNEIVVYQPNETTRIDVRLEGGTVWLSQAQISDLFGRSISVISRHIKNVFDEGEVDAKSNLHFLQIANSDRPIAIYSLNVIISVGYRVKSVVGTQFRIWATRIIQQRILGQSAFEPRMTKLENRMDALELELKRAEPLPCWRLAQRCWKEEIRHHPHDAPTRRHPPERRPRMTHTLYKMCSGLKGRALTHRTPDSHRFARCMRPATPTRWNTVYKMCAVNPWCGVKGAWNTVYKMCAEDLAHDREDRLHTVYKMCAVNSGDSVKGVWNTVYKMCSNIRCTPTPTTYTIKNYELRMRNEELRCRFISAEIGRMLTTMLKKFGTLHRTPTPTTYTSPTPIPNS